MDTRYAKNPILLGVFARASICCGNLVEVMGIEPMSEIASSGTSPGAARE